MQKITSQQQKRPQSERKSLKNNNKERFYTQTLLQLISLAVTISINVATSRATIRDHHAKTFHHFTWKRKAEITYSYCFMRRTETIRFCAKPRKCNKIAFRNAVAPHCKSYCYSTGREQGIDWHPEKETDKTNQRKQNRQAYTNPLFHARKTATKLIEKTGSTSL